MVRGPSRSSRLRWRGAFQSDRSAALCTARRWGPETSLDGLERYSVSSRGRAWAI